VCVCTFAKAEQLLLISCLEYFSEINVNVSGLHIRNSIYVVSNFGILQADESVPNFKASHKYLVNAVVY